jgi:hypothetical protein
VVGLAPHDDRDTERDLAGLTGPGARDQRGDGAVDESDCDGYNSDFIYVQPDGTTSETVYVDARISTRRPTGGPRCR